MDAIPKQSNDSQSLENIAPAPSQQDKKQEVITGSQKMRPHGQQLHFPYQQDRDNRRNEYLETSQQNKGFYQAQPTRHSGAPFIDSGYPELGQEAVPRPSSNSFTRPSLAESSNGSLGSLEDRLRGLIMSNTGDSHAAVDDNYERKSNNLPPHMRNASNEDQKAFLDRQKGRVESNASLPLGGVPTPHTPPPRKRMNQAQRRQMQFQLNLSGPSNSSPNRPHPHPVPRTDLYPAGRVMLGSTQAQPWPSNRPAGFSEYQAFPTRGPLPPHPHPQEQRQQDYQIGANYMQPALDYQARPQPQNRQLYQPHPGVSSIGQERHRPYHPHQIDWDEIKRQSDYLQESAMTTVADAVVSEAELREKESFRVTLESVCRNAIGDHERKLGTGTTFDSNSVALQCFGSISSGFATKSSDMDLALLSPHSLAPPDSPDSPIPRILEKAFLDRGFGARLLTRARVPIIKLCENPSKEFMELLKDERDNWEKETSSPNVKDESSLEPSKKNLAADDELGEEDEQDHLVQTMERSAKPDLSRVSQKRYEDLYGYFRRLKGLLVKLGGNDMNVAQNASMEEDQIQLMNQVSDAFVLGLHEEELRERLRSKLEVDLTRSVRPISLVWMQAEGERLAMSWEKRTIHEATAADELRGQDLIREWRVLHETAGSDLVHYYKGIHRVWDKLKSLPSARVGVFAQRKDESPFTYIVRSKAILHELQGRDRGVAMQVPMSEREEALLDVVIERFANGIVDGIVKQHLQDYVTCPEKLALAQVNSQFRMETRLRLYQKAAEKGLYSEEEQKVIEEFSAIIRQERCLSPSTELIEAQKKFEALKEPAQPQSKDRYFDRLEFPRTGIGIQCDVNFSNHLALQNTTLLRCYSHCDPRVRPMVLYIKAWVKRRGINSPYHGTLSSYGYVLMVLHFLVNVAVPPVVPNLQLAWRPPPHGSWGSLVESETRVEGYDVRFWRQEEEIKSLSAKGMLTHNNQSVGSLLREFFDYFARQGPSVISNGFFWGQDLLSLRTQGGLLPKRSKGWTGAKTTVTEPTQPGQHKKEVRHRYLFAIEDPFETDHNIARTVTHNGIVAIRDEFRRAWRIISCVGKRTEAEQEDLLKAVDETPEPSKTSVEQTGLEHQQSPTTPSVVGQG
ncbi:MAG: hypothetical protein M1837_007272 [Sclerophora amabilis]|nr:MAG: hypothetical protein M1837_007272 [Sclerophora amabilis]